MKYRQLLFMTTLILLLMLHLARLFVSAKPTPSEAHTDESSLIREKIEAFKSDVLNRLGYVNPPNVSNVNISIQEKRKMITLYMKYIEERNGTHKEEDDSGMVHSRNFHTLEYAEICVSSITLISG
ncbi:hypothetical protein CHS0354_006973 [Potamilus streckersoni]|uniref:Uncharacterized protein n=1 Tax=Potamilus streckersoni TaxID=2493646 RepID=A0AAE0VJV1_9BIVA|nr:hypothetical protein CHS0354_006973 [Potamilus streckersoni]